MSPLEVVIHVYYYPREVFGAVIATFWSISGTIRLLPSSSTFVLASDGGTYVLRGTFVLPQGGVWPFIARRYANGKLC